jgi:putative hemolysin
MPQVGDIVVWENWRFEIVDMDGKRIDRVLASEVPLEDGEPSEEPTV